MVGVLKKLVVVLAGIGLAISGGAQNICNSATNITTLPYNSGNSTTTCGTNDDYNPFTLCGVAGTNGQDAVYKFTPSVANSCINITFDGRNANTLNAAAALFIFDRCPGLPGAECVFSRVNNGANIMNINNLSLDPGTTYYIVLDGGTSGSPVCYQYKLSLATATCSTPTATNAPGTNCANPINISFPYTNNSGTTAGFAADYTGGCKDPFNGGEDVYYKFTLTSTKCIRYSVKGLSTGATVYLTNGCPGTAGTTCVKTDICRDPYCTGIIEEPTLAAGTYYIVVKADNPSKSATYAISIESLTGDDNLTCLTCNDSDNCAPCKNAGFEKMSLNGWNGAYGTYTTPNQTAGFVTGNMDNGMTRHTITSRGHFDSLITVLPAVPPTGGDYALRLGNANNGTQGEQISYSVLIDSNNTSFVYQYAVVFEDPAHAEEEQPYFSIQMNVGGQNIACAYYEVRPRPGLDGYKDGGLSPGNPGTAPGSVAQGTGSPMYYKEWTTVNIPLIDYIGQNATITFTTKDCSRGGHFGYAYLDARCEKLAITKPVDKVYCKGDSILIQAPPGFATYAWSNGMTTQNIKVGKKGIYTVTCTTVTGCVIQLSTEIKMESAPIPKFTRTFNCTDQRFYFTDQSVIQDSTPIVKRLWTFGDGDSSLLQNPSHQYATSGNYNVKLTLFTANGCFSDTTITVPVYVTPKLEVDINGASKICSDSNTVITAIPSGGLAPYTYVWSNGTGNQSTSVTSGKYIVTVSDATGYGCTAKDSITIVVSPPITVNITADTLYACSAGSFVTATATGSNTIATYIWSNGDGGKTVSIGPGKYFLTATDSTGCKAMDSVVVVQPTAVISATVTEPPAVCNGTTGTLIGQGVNGYGGYTYLWNSGEITKNITKSPGTYCVTVTDVRGCFASACGLVAQLPVLTAKITGYLKVCPGGGTTTLGATVNGGQSPYTYSWSNGATSTSISNVGPGTYYLTISDASGYSCRASDTVTITTAPLLSVNIIADTLFNCTSSTTVTASASSSGGVAPVTYLWSNGDGNTSTNLGAGKQYLTVTDSIGCKASDTVTVKLPTNTLTGTIDSIAPVCNGASGTITAQGVNGYGSYTYLWSTGETTKSVTKPAGTYSVTVTDSKGCTATATRIIQELPVLTVSIGGFNKVCSGATTTITANPTGGKSPYTYLWSTGATAQSISVGVGSYSVTVKDGSGYLCSANASITITTSPAVTAIITPDTLYACTASSQVSATANGSGGAGPFTYLWSNGDGNKTTSLPVGKHYVTVTDSIGCSAKDSVIVTSPTTVLSATIDSIAPLCFGTTGTITAQGVNGYGSYTYSWSTGESTKSITKGAGSYTVTVTDLRGCTATSTRNIQELALLTASISGSTLVCSGTTTTLTAVVNGGKSPYTYVWSTGATTSSISAGAGTYNLTVTDASGYNCTATASTTITTDPAITVNIIPDTIYACSNTASATASASGGTGALTYSWTNGDGTPTTIVTPGKHIVTVTDAVGCTRKDSVMVVIPTTFLSATIDSLAPLCFGTTGTITAQGVNGYGSYTYSWSTGETTKSITKPAGTYTVTVTDLRGCTATFTRTIQELPVLAASINGSAFICSGFTTTLTANPTGGKAPYTYLWNTGATTQSITAGAGSYSVTVVDASGHNCTTSANFTVTTGAAVTANITLDSIFACASTVNATVVAAGGSGTYTYLWSNGDGTATTTLTTGRHTVIVSDNSGCTAKDSVFVSIPSSFLSATIDSIAPVCFGTNGTITAQGVNGYGGYTYSWSSGETTKAITKPAGTYTITITDAKGCTATATRIIQELPVLTVTIDGAAQVCIGSTATLTASPTGGKAPYTYLWNTGATTASITGPAGLYSVTITDASGYSCTATASKTVTNAAAVTANIAIDTAFSCGPSTPISVTASGGAGTSFTYSWSNGDGGPTTFVAPGKYTVTVTDSIGCGAQDSVVVTAPAAYVTATIDSIAPVCNGTSGTITAQGVGGYGTYTYLWSSGESVKTITKPAGTYTVTITDSKGCTAMASRTIQELNSLTATIAGSALVCTGTSSTITANPTGGKAPYTYQWNTGATTQSITAAAGTYNVTITDGSGYSCTTTASIAISNAPAVTAIIAVDTLYSCAGTITATASSSGGTGPKTYLWSNGDGSATTILTGTGKYYVTATDSLGCFNTDSVIVTVPTTAINATIDSIAPVCNAGMGTITAQGVNGYGGYTYLWNTGETTKSITKPAGTYTVTVTDAKGCSATATRVISQLTAMSGSIAGSSIVCVGSTATLTASATGGKAPYSYSWSNGATTQSVNVLAGTYMVTITDASGYSCSATAVKTLSNAPVISVNIPLDTIFGCTNSNPIIVTATGGAGSNFTYAWSNGDGGPTTYVGAGTWTVTVTDSLGCTAKDSVVVVVPSSFLSATIDSIAPLCNGTTGTITAQGVNGYGTYTYLWNTGETIKAITKPAGTYIVTVTDGKGCSATATRVIQELPVLTTVINGSQLVCVGDSSTLTAVPTGGVAPYSYLWSTGAVTSSVKVAAGNYSVTVTDGSGYSCTATASKTVTNAAVVTAAIAVDTLFACSSTRSATVVPGGGSGVYTYLWSNGDGGATTTLGAGKHYATVTDSLGCSATDSVVVTVPSSFLSATIDSIAPVCFGTSGTITAQGVNGFGGYTYSWSTGETTKAITKPAGTYIVTVTDAKGCTANSTRIIQQLPVLTTTINGSGLVCVGTNSTLTAAPTGGVAPYTYLWSNGATTASISVPAGNYSVTVTDGSGYSCSASASKSVTNAALVTANIAVDTLYACATTKTANVTAGGGSGVYNYLWSNGDGGASTALPAGKHFVTVTDSLGCSAIDSVVIVIPSAFLTATVDSVAPLCFGTSGTLTGQGVDGYGGYTYLWNTGETTKMVSKAAGTYTVTVTDAKGCKATATRIIQELPVLTVTVAGATLVCIGDSSTFTATPSGGKAPYTYSWNNGATTASIKVPQGTYTVTVTDASGYSCTASASKTVTNAAAVTANISADTVFGCTPTNPVTVTASGGAGTSFTYGWSNGDGGPTVFVGPGKYTVTVTDSLGCKAQDSVVVTIPSTFLSATVDSVAPVCNGTNGTITAQGHDGYGTYTYSWSSGETVKSISKPAGTYVVTVTDAKGCMATAIRTIQELDPLTAVVTGSNYVCIASTTTVTAEPTGGQAPYTYAWSNGATSQSITVAAGTYSVIITDASGYNCSTTATKIITTSPPVVANITPDTIYACSTSASARVIATGGIGEFHYLWSTGDGSHTATLPVGKHFVTVTDDVGCSGTDSVVVTIPSAFLTATIDTVLPVCNGGLGTLTARGHDGWSGYSYKWSTGETTQAISKTAGSYTVTVTDAKGCTAVATRIIQDLPVLSLNITGSTIVCVGSGTTLTANPTGGQTPYTYAWSNGATTPSISAPAGTYTVTVTDGSGYNCTASASITVTNSPAITANIAVDTLYSCTGTRIATVTASGGSGSYTYLWSNGDGGSSATLPAGKFIVSVTDSLGCVAKDSVVIIIPSAYLSATIDSLAPLCNGASGLLTAQGIDGFGGYTYSWSTGETTKSVTKSAGTYMVTVTDAKGCIATATRVIQELPVLSAVVNGGTLVCVGDSSVLTATPSGGKAPYTYHWNTGALTQSIKMPAGTYTVTVTDGSGYSCTTSSSITVTNAAVVTASIAVDTLFACAPTRSASVTAGGGSGVYTYLWSNGDGSATTTLPAGKHSVVVTDSLGCSAIDSVVIAIPAAFISSTIDSIAPVCFGTSGTITAQGLNGFGGFTYLWSTGESTKSITKPAGTYTVTVTDAKGCTSSSSRVIQELNVLTATVSGSSLVCTGDSVTLSATVSGGKAPYSYLWSNGFSTQSISAIAGTYTVTVTDASGYSCTTTATKVVSNAPTITVDIPLDTVFACSNTTTISVTASGGASSAFTYLWSNGDGSATTIVGPGKYTVTVKDSLGCSAKDSVEVTIPSAFLTSSIDTINPVCFGTSGTITAQGYNGYGSYTYLWNTGESTKFVNKPAGTYTVTVTDAKGCTSISTRIIQELNVLTASITGSGLVCIGDSVTLTATVTGGKAPYTYAWNNGASTASISAPAGTYTVTVTDASGYSCTSASTKVVSNAAAVTASIALDTVFGCTNNTPITVNASGGAGTSFTYTWSNGDGGPTTSVGPGKYFVTVTDSLGCKATDSVFVKVPSAFLSATIDSVAAVCNGTNGTITAQGEDGYGGYTYQWATGESTKMVTKPAGTYTVTVTDAKGCTAIAIRSILELPVLNVNIAGATLVCIGDSSTFTATPTGGKAPYTYAWNTGATTQSIKAPQGTYSVTVTDASGYSCTASASKTISNEAAVTADIAADTVFGCTNSNPVSVTASGGAGTSFTYSWSNGDGGPTVYVGPGKYTVTVIDSLGCKAQDSVVVTVPNNFITATVDSVAPVCNGTSGTITAQGHDGYGTYTYSWSSGENVKSITRPAGAYIVTVTDAKGCTAAATRIIQELNVLSATITGSGLVCVGSTTNVTANPTGGKSPYTYLWSNGATTQTVAATSGTISVTVTDASGYSCTATASKTLVNAPPVMANIPLDTLFGCSNTSTVTVTATGGASSNFTYLWSNGDGTATTLVGPGKYVVTVTDSLGCSAKDSVEVTIPSAFLKASVDSISPVCNGSTGTITASGIDGYGGYTYMWNSGEATRSVTKPAGTYTVTVSDAKGCTATAIRVIQQLGTLSATVVGSNVICVGDSATLTATPSGGQAPYNYLWSTGATTQSIKAIAGTYSVSVTDGSGYNCTASASTTVSNAPVVVATIVPDSIFACTPTTTATASGSGGTGSFTYLWSTGDGSQSVTLPAGKHFVTVTDAIGCHSEDSVVVVVPSAFLTATIDSIAPLCNGATGTITAQGVNGYGGYTYLWASGESTKAITKTAGTYTVTVTDAKGCISTAIRTIQELSNLNVSVVGSNQVCIGNNASLTANVTGGKAPYTYVWSNGGSTQTVSVPAGTYTVTVSDASGYSCTAIANKTVTNVPAVIADIPLDTLFGCTNSSLISVTASGGAGTPFTYTWSNGDGGPSTTVGPGTWKVTVKDSLGCSASDSVVVTIPNAFLSATVDSISPVCNGMSGTITASGIGGYGTYTYLWNTGDQTKSITKPAGTYIVSVSDSKGCKANATRVIQDLPVLITVINGPATICITDSATLTASPTGGVAPYTYLWSTGATTAAIKAIAGNYSVIVTDGSGYSCTATASKSVTNAPVVTVNIAVDTLYACTSTKSATATAGGGTGPFTYLWSTGDGGGTVALPVGKHFVTVTDAVGCHATDSVVVVIPSAFLSATVDSVAPLCNGSVATITAQGKDGYGGYTYLWTSGETTKSITKNAGTYSVTVTDIHACKAAFTRTIQQLAPLNLIVNGPPRICPGDSAVLTAVASGGKAPYTYLWNNGATTASITAKPGTYTLTVKDSSGYQCSMTTNKNLQLAPAVLANILPDTIFACEPTVQGRINASGGTGEFTYLWSTGDGGQTVTLPAGKHSATVFDALGCKATDSVVVTVPSAFLTATIDSVAPVCFEANGTITAQGHDGYGGFSYQWSTGESTKSVTKGAGDYEVTVTDIKGCFATASRTIQQLNGLTASISGASQVCVGDSAILTVQTFGGKAPYTYQWSSGQSSSSVSVPKGTYSVVVTDNSGYACTVTVNKTIVNAPVVGIGVSADSIYSCTPTTSASVSATGGSGAFTYLWSTGDGGSTVTLPAGKHYVTATDELGCKATDSIYIAVPDTFLSAVIDSISPICNGTTGTITAQGLNGYGGFTYQWASGETSKAITKPAGTYIITVTDLKGCTATATRVIQQLSTLSASITGDSLTCINSNGTITAVATGGKAPYSYKWSNGQFTASITAPVGTYSVEISDASGYNCTASASIEIKNSPAITASITPDSVFACKATDLVSVSATASGGTGAYSFSWSNGEGSANVSLAAGHYVVTASDALGCKAKDSIDVIAPTTPLNAAIDSTPVVCFGATGTLTALGSNGFGSFTYQWSSGESTKSITKTSGNYCVTITDAKGCTAIACRTLLEAPELTLSINGPLNVCKGSTTNLTAVPVGGATPYTYTWSTGHSTPSITNVNPGPYSVIVEDANRCAKTATITVRESNRLSNSISVQDVICFGTATGSATATTAGGLAPYTYKWTPGDFNTKSITNLASQTYKLTITDSIGCTLSDSVTVNQPSQLVINTRSLTEIACAGGNNGSAEVAAAGGNPNYTYNWSPSGGNQAIASNLGAGTYTVTVTDAKGCTANKLITILQPQPLTAIALPTNLSCFNANDGKMRVNVAGGTLPYAYNWNPNISGLDSATNLKSGAYTVEVSDARNCKITAGATITEPAEIKVSASSTSSYCSLSLGTALATVNSGGFLPFTYQWDANAANQTTNPATQLAPGFYTVIVKDRFNCQGTADVNVGNIGGFAATVVSTKPITCKNANDATATVSVSGTGVAPFTYEWFNKNTGQSLGQNTATVTDLAPGQYYVKVTDKNGCSASTSDFTISNPPTFRVNITKTNITCYEACDGTASAVINGGIAPYAFKWDDVSIQTTQTAYSMCPGIYNVVVRDANGCLDTANVQITEPGPLTLDSSVVNTECGESKGSACVLISGGVGPYASLWPDGQTEQCVNTLSANTYIVKVTDNNGCVERLPITVSNINTPQPEIRSIQYPKCFGDCDGLVTVGLAGDSTFFTVEWSANAGPQQGVTAAGLCADIYTVKFTTDHGCVSSMAVTINTPDEITLNLASTNPKCFNSCDGKASVIARGGVAPYSYQWISNDGTLVSSTDRMSNICADSYRLLVIDANGCSKEMTFDITNPLPFTATTNNKNLNCNSICDGAIEAIPLNGVGPFNYQWDANAKNQQTRNATGLCAGDYTCTITDVNGCVALAKTSLTQPDSLILYQQAKGDVSCKGRCDGYAMVRIAGGTAPYAYDWTGGLGNGTVAKDLCPGTITTTVTDANGCQSITKFTINEPAPLAVTVRTNNGNCAEDCQGTALSQIGGGTQPYSVIWDAPGGPNTMFVDSLCQGTYTAYVTDANGCTANNYGVIGEPATLGFNITQSLASCGFENGQICVTAYGGKAPYTYLWSDLRQQTTACADSLRSGCYEVIVEDAAGCVKRELICLGDIDGPGVSLVSYKDLSCFNSKDGYLEFAFTGGNGLVKTKLIDENNKVIDSNTVFTTGLSANCYTFIATDSKGCKSPLTHCLVEPIKLTAFVMSKTDATCFQKCDGTAVAKASGGTAPYSITWNGGTSASSFSNIGICPGIVKATVTDSNGCQANTDILIEQPTVLKIDSAKITNPKCFGECNGEILSYTNGGSLPYEYRWSTDSVNSPNLTNVCKGVVSLQVVDRYGCATSRSFVLNEPSEIELLMDSTMATCSSCNGTATAMVTGGVKPYKYDWAGAGSAPDSAVTRSLCAGTYQVRVTDASGCLVNGFTTVLGATRPKIDSIRVKNPNCSNTLDGSLTTFVSGGFGNISYKWDAATGNQSTQTAVSLKSGSYCVTVTDETGCAANRCASVMSPQPVTPIPSLSKEVCRGAATQIYAGATGGSYQYTYYWSDPEFAGAGPFVVKPTQTTTYCFNVEDNKGCRSKDTCITLTVTPDPKLQVPNGSEICQGDSVTILAKVIGGRNSSYTWNWKNTDQSTIFSNNNHDLSTVKVTPDTTGFVYVNVLDGCFRPAIDSVFIVVNQQPNLNFIPIDRRGCAPFLVTLNFTNANKNFYEVDFQCDGQADSFGPDSVVSYQYQDTGVYSVCIKATSDKGCVAYKAYNNMYTVYPTPSAEFEVNPTILGILDPTVTVTDLSQGHDRMSWSFGDGFNVAGHRDSVFTNTRGPLSGEMTNLKYTYAEAGSYNIQLAVANRYGCIAVYNIPIVVEPDFEFYVPNAFTPDGDGFNDIFEPKGVGFAPENYKLQIWDRWGEVIFESNNYNNRWDGRTKKGVVQNDVYVWTIELTDFRGKKHNYTGHVTVFR